MARPRSEPDFHLLSKVSTLYYLRDHTQQEIAERLHISRPKVSRLLQEAQDQGIVRITIAPPTGLHLELENQLEYAFGLEEAQVVDVDSAHADAVFRQIGSGAASYLARTVQPGETIGLTWGRTLNAMVDALSPQPTRGVRVVQTLGGVGRPESDAYAARLVPRLAELLEASAVMLPAPGIVGTSDARDVLRDDPHIQAAMREFEKLDVAFVGISSLESSAFLHDGHSVAPGMLEELQASGVSGHIALRFFDAEGAPVETSLDDRILGITHDQLLKVPRVVAAAGGVDKVDAIHAALLGKLVDVLIIDQLTARALMARGAGEALAGAASSAPG